MICLNGGGIAYPTLQAALDAATNDDVITIVDERIIPMRTELNARADRARPLAGSICEACFDAPAVTIREAPWGGEMGVCVPCDAAL